MKPDPGANVFPEWRGMRAGFVMPPETVHVTGTFVLGPISGTFALDLPLPASGPADRVELQTTRYSPLEGGPIMSGTISLPTNQIAHTPVLWTAAGATVAAPADAVAVSSDPSLGTVAFNPGMTSVDTTPVGATGSFMVTVSSASAGISDSMSVTLAAAGAADTVVLDAGATTFTPKP